MWLLGPFPDVPQGSFRLFFGDGSHPLVFLWKVILLQDTHVLQNLLDGHASHKFQLFSCRRVQGITQPGRPSEILRPVVLSIGVYMVDDIGFCFGFAMESCRDDSVNLMGTDEEILIPRVMGSECPFVVAFSRLCRIFWKPQNRAVITDTVMVVPVVAFAFFGVDVQKLFLLFESFEIIHVAGSFNRYRGW